MDRWITPAGDGTFVLELDPRERDLLRSLLGDLRSLLVDGSDPSLRRLFPPAYVDDEDREQEYKALAHDELLEHRLAGIDIMVHTIDQERLDEEQLDDWLRVVNQVRLVLGTQLDVVEDEGPDLDPDDPDEPRKRLYLYLGLLLDDIVDALGSGLTGPGR